MKTDLVLQALSIATKQRHISKLIHHQVRAKLRGS